MKGTKWVAYCAECGEKFAIDSPEAQAGFHVVVGIERDHNGNPVQVQCQCGPIVAQEEV